MDPNTIKVQLFLKVILPHLETLMELEPSMPGLVRGWNNVIQFEVLDGGPCGYLQFTDGRLKVHEGAHENPTVLFAFKTVQDFVDMIDEKTKPMPKKGLFHLIILLKFMKLTKILTQTLKPDEASLSNPESLKKTVTLMLYTAAFGMKYIAEYDEGVATTLDHLSDGAAQFIVLDDGPYAYVDVKEKKLSPHKGRAEKAMVEMEIKDMKTAFKLLNDDIDAMAAIGAGDIVLRGYLPLFGDISYIMGRISKYLQ